MFSIARFLAACLVMCLVFGVLVFGMLLMNPVSFINSYPPEIQAEYYRSQSKEAARRKLTVIMGIKKAAALTAFLFLFAWMAKWAGADTFGEGLMAVYGYGLVLAVFDTCFLDWVLFPNIRRIRLPGTEHMDREYRQKWFHVKAMLPMLPLFAVGCVAAALIMVWIW